MQCVSDNIKKQEKDTWYRKLSSWEFQKIGNDGIKKVEFISDSDIRVKKDL